MNLSNNLIIKEDLIRIQDSPWDNLTNLNLSNCFQDIQAVTILFKCLLLKWNKIQILNLSMNNVIDEHINLINSDFLNNIVEINLESNFISEVGIKSLSKNTNWKNLKILILCGNEIRESGFNSIIECKDWDLHELGVEFYIKIQSLDQILKIYEIKKNLNILHLDEVYIEEINKFNDLVEENQVLKLNKIITDNKKKYLFFCKRNLKCEVAVENGNISIEKNILMKFESIGGGKNCSSSSIKYICRSMK